MFNIFREYANPDKSRLAGNNYRRIRERRLQFMGRAAAAYGDGNRSFQAWLQRKLGKEAAVYG